MESTLKKAKVPYRSDIITAATDKKLSSGKRISNIILGFFMLGIGLYGLYGALYGLVALFTTPFKLVMGVLLIFAIVVMLLLGAFCIYAAFRSFSPKSEWFIILYQDKILYKYRQDQSYREVVIEINDLCKCMVMHKIWMSKLLKGRNATQYDISVHLEYMENEEKQVISLEQMDGYHELNRLIRYLTADKDIPFFYVEIDKGYNEKPDDLEVLKDAEETDFLGGLKRYQKVSSIHYHR